MSKNFSDETLVTKPNEIKSRILKEKAKNLDFFTDPF